MNKPFSEMVEDELYDIEYTFKTLSKIANELKGLLRRNAYLEAENKELKRRIKEYQNNAGESFKQAQANIAMALRDCLIKGE